jgi:hypothetical protein
MGEFTSGQMNERITEIDSLIFKAQTAQIALTDEEYEALKIEVESLMHVLAEHLSVEMGRPVAEVYADRQKVRDLDWIAMMAEHHKKIFPVPVPAHDAIIAAAFRDKRKSSEQVARELNHLFGYMFVNHQTKTKPILKKKGFLARIFNNQKP